MLLAGVLTLLAFLNLADDACNPLPPRMHSRLKERNMFRLVVGVLVAFALSLPVRAHAGELTPAQAKAVFERLKQLAGQWEARSTEGWSGRHVMRILAGGSVVMSISQIEPHPGEDEGMVTAYHLDGDRLLLTHYCVAKNQPRLEAAGASADGKTIEFAFVDGTNMRSRDVGHMDRAILTIESADRYTSRWTFYQNGKETWMEEIVNTRRR